MSYERYTDLMNLIGYGLAKFDVDLVREFAFSSKMAFYRYCVEAGFAKSVKAISNRQDSFDPYFDNGRKGWHQRKQREHIKLFIDSLFGSENAKGFASIIKMYMKEFKHDIEIPNQLIPPTIQSKFKQLQLSGREAEFYFMQNYRKINMFANTTLEDARLWGDGYDFQIKSMDKYFLIEVKGVREKTGAIRMTQKEFEKASEYREDYFLVVVSNLSHTPKLNFIINPLQHIKLTPKITYTTQTNYYSDSLCW